MCWKLHKFFWGFIFLFICTDLYGVQIVQLKTRISNNTTISGYGFVIYEANNQKYILTANHVVIPKCDSCTVDSIIVDNTYRAEIIDIHPTEDIIILSIRSKRKKIKDYRSLLVESNVGDKVYVSGRFGYTEDSEPGEITNANNHFLEAEISGISIGSSGGPLFLFPNKINKEIVGLIIKDDNKNATAISALFMRIKS